MPHLTQLQSMLGLNAMSLDTRAMIESIVAIAALLYALALRHRRGNLRAWPVAMVGVGLAIDIALLPLIGHAPFTYLDTAAVILFDFAV